MEESNADLSGALKNLADVEMKEEAKSAFKSKKDIAKQQMLEDDNASDDSGEGVDSDDLDDEIQDNVEQLVMQQQMYMPEMQRQQLPSSSLFGGMQPHQQIQAPLFAQQQQMQAPAGGLFGAQPQMNAQLPQAQASYGGFAQPEAKKKSSIGGFFGKLFSKEPQ